MTERPFINVDEYELLDVIAVLEAVPALLADAVEQRGVSWRSVARDLDATHVNLLRVVRRQTQPSLDLTIRILRWLADDEGDHA